MVREVAKVGGGEGGFWKKLTCVSWERRVVMASWRIAHVDRKQAVNLVGPEIQK